MVRLRCTGFWERLLIPAFVFYFTLLYPFRAVNNPASPIAGAAGGTILIRRAALEAIGGMPALKGAVIDDCALGRAVKRAGFRIWLGFGERSFSLRGYDKLSQVWRIVERSAYTQLKHSPVLLAGVLAGLALSHFGPVWLALVHGSFWGLGAWAVMAAIYWPTVRFYGLSPLWSLTLPLAATLFGAMTLTSAIRYYLGGQNDWRGRDVQENIAKSPDYP
ncbi:MAG TPA: hypothetical protein ENJ99_03105 [Rhizobiales bacterium]|nr:hypothetical protein [Hyphomicrobiales bacterium]